MYWWSPFIFGCAVVVFFAQSLRAQDRHALVVGIDEYEKATSLANAVNDAVSVSEALEGMDFKVTRVINAGKTELIDEINKFFGSINGADCALFFYAGHGVQSRGQNFLIPGDFDGLTEEDLWRSAVPIDRVVSSLANGQQKVSVVILDACRDNPLSDAEIAGVVGKKGLAPINPPVGSLIAYSADAGQIAIDGKGDAENGLYTGFLTDAMTRPGLRAEDIFNETRKKVVEASEGIQTPAEYSKLINTFYFKPAPGQTNLPAAAVPPISNLSSPVPLVLERRQSPVVSSLRNYYESVNSRDFAMAYGRLSAKFKSRRSVEQYRSIFSTTLAVYPVRFDLISNQDGRAVVYVELVVVDDAKTRTTWKGPVVMVQEGGEWKMETSKELRKSSEFHLSEARVNASLPKEHAAVAAANHYYREVNLREFESAYRCLSSGFRSRLSASRYRSIFDSTLSTYLKTATVQKEGQNSAQVYVELDVIDEQGVRSTWSGPVSFALESGRWKIETMRGLKQQ